MTWCFYPLNWTYFRKNTYNIRCVKYLAASAWFIYLASWAPLRSWWNRLVFFGAIWMFYAKQSLSYHGLLCLAPQKKRPSSKGSRRLVSQSRPKKQFFYLWAQPALRSRSVSYHLLPMLDTTTSCPYTCLFFLGHINHAVQGVVPSTFPLWYEYDAPSKSPNLSSTTQQTHQMTLDT